MTTFGALQQHPDRISTLLQHLRAGCDVDKSCRVAYIPRSSYYSWLTNAREARAELPAEEWNEYQKKCVEFEEAVELARAQSVTSLELVIAQAARSDWRAAERMLKKLEQGTWSGTQKVELTGPEGGPITVAAVPSQPDLTDESQARAIWEARAEMGDERAKALLAALDA